jgi:hypothetical protein
MYSGVYLEGTVNFKNGKPYIGDTSVDQALHLLEGNVIHCNLNLMNEYPPTACVPTGIPVNKEVTNGDIGTCETAG